MEIKQLLQAPAHPPYYEPPPRYEYPEVLKKAEVVAKPPKVARPAPSGTLPDEVVVNIIPAGEKEPIKEKVSPAVEKLTFPGHTPPHPEVITEQIVRATKRRPEATHVHVVTTDQDYHVHVPSTKAAAEISGMDYKDWLLLYGYGIVK